MVRLTIKYAVVEYLNARRDEDQEGHQNTLSNGNVLI
jgi:hypothetical protein